MADRKWFADLLMKGMHTMYGTKSLQKAPMPNVEELAAMQAEAAREADRTFGLPNAEALNVLQTRVSGNAMSSMQLANERAMAAHRAMNGQQMDWARAQIADPEYSAHQQRLQQSLEDHEAAKKELEAEILGSCEYFMFHPDTEQSNPNAHVISFDPVVQVYHKALPMEREYFTAAKALENPEMFRLWCEGCELSFQIVHVFVGDHPMTLAYDHHANMRHQQAMIALNAGVASSPGYSHYANLYGSDTLPPWSNTP